MIIVKSKKWLVSELGNSSVMMDEEGNQFNHYDNFIVVYNRGEKIKISYKLFKVFDVKELIYDATQKNPFIKK